MGGNLCRCGCYLKIEDAVNLGWKLGAVVLVVLGSMVMGRSRTGSGPV